MKRLSVDLLDLDENGLVFIPPKSCFDVGGLLNGERVVLVFNDIEGDTKEVEANVVMLKNEWRARVSPIKTQEKTVRVRVYVTVNDRGEWAAQGWAGASDDDVKDAVFLEDVADCEIGYWLTTELPLPTVQEVALTPDQITED